MSPWYRNRTTPPYGIIGNTSRGAGSTCEENPCAGKQEPSLDPDRYCRRELA
jgi:hypothetical protein